MIDLTGRTALVTGGNRGIGRAVAIALARAGADVALTYHTRENEAREAARAIEATGRRVLVRQADVGRRDDLARIADETLRAFGAVDILVNNAGIIRPQPIAEITARDWDELIAVNLTSVFLLTQAVLPGMRARHWGRIVNLSSVAAQLGGVVGPHYAASKAGLFGLTHAYAAMLAREGITVNTIAPALIETEMVTSNPRARADLIPVGRFGAVDEVADVAVMLAGNGYVTGQTINVNGGWYMS
ncbi:MAG TPA: 3-oxoacyl-ACP reductase family protein [Vicinamibacterales bacterium]|jgi:3-oxoacyl-[acyl-carrier protein] reductase|nr:3-oxoacyl-ACP reductase family protein [Vicinamibacterales bacterium]